MFPYIDFLSSQLFANILLFITVLVAFAVGYRQIYLSDVVEIYAVPDSKMVIHGTSTTRVPIIYLQNVGTRIVYLDKYIFNGREYIKHGQILPPSLTQSGGGYWIDLPTNGENHVSLTLLYSDQDSRMWKSHINAELRDGIWNVDSLRRTQVKY